MAQPEPDTTIDVAQNAENLDTPTLSQIPLQLCLTKQCENLLNSARWTVMLLSGSPFARGITFIGGLVCYWLAFPPFEFAPAGWFAPLLWLIALQNMKPLQRYRAMFCVGYALTVAMVFWLWALFGVMAIALWGILALMFSLWGFLISFPRFRSPVLEVLWPAVSWCAVEYFRSEVWGLRFSWFALGYSQQNLLGSILAPWFGVYGISFLMVLWGSLFTALCTMRLHVGHRCLAAVLLCLVPLLALSPLPKWSGEVLGQAMLQQMKSGGHFPAVAEELAPTVPMDLVIWPESVLFGNPLQSRHGAFLRLMNRQAASTKWGVIFGAQDNLTSRSDDFYNTAFLMAPSGDILGKAVKNQPVQFTVDGSPALDVEVCEIPVPDRDEPIHVGIGICYDGSYQQFARKMTLRGADFLAFPTFNVSGWGAIQHLQHQRMFQMRAMENRRSVLVAAFSGPTFGTFPNGLISNALPFGKTSSLVVPICKPAPVPVFVEVGWLLSPLCLFAALGILVWNIWLRFSPRGSEPTGSVFEMKEFPFTVEDVSTEAQQEEDGTGSAENSTQESIGVGGTPLVDDSDPSTG